MSGRAEEAVTTFVANCPECYQKCWWCSGYQWTIREIGCMTIYPRRGKCKHGESAKGQTCGTCDGSHKVTVEQRIVPRTAGA